MTITNETFEKSYTTVGTLNEAFPTTFQFNNAEDLDVILDGAIQLLGTNYTVSGGSGAVGTVTWVGTPTAAKTLEIIGRGPATQTEDYLEDDAFGAETHEKALDRLAMALRSALLRSTSDHRIFDALGARLSNLATPTAASDAATKAYADGLSAPTITIPTPANPGDDDEVLTAAAGAYLTELPPFKKTDLPSAADGAASRVFTATGAGTFAWQDLPATTTPPPSENYIFNGQMAVCQRHADGGTFSAASVTPNSDGNYLLDGFALLSDGNNIVEVTQSTTTPPDGAKFSMRSIVQTINKKWGFIHFLDNERTIQLRKDGATSRASLQFKARTTTGAAVGNLRAAILAWTSTVDQPTKDVVSAWNAAGADPGFVANYTVENVPANLVLVVDTWTTFQIENILLDAAANNIAIFIWVDDDNSAANDDLFITDIQLNPGATAEAFVRRTKAEDLDEAHRRFATSYPQNVEPGTVSAAGALRIHSASATTAGALMFNPIWPVIMRAAPSVIAFSPSLATAGNCSDSAGADKPVTVDLITDFSCRIDNDGAVTANAQHQCHYTADSELGV